MPRLSFNREIVTQRALRVSLQHVPGFVITYLFYIGSSLVRILPKEPTTSKPSQVVNFWACPIQIQPADLLAGLK